MTQKLHEAAREADSARHSRCEERSLAQGALTRVRLEVAMACQRIENAVERIKRKRELLESR